MPTAGSVGAGGVAAVEIANAAVALEGVEAERFAVRDRGAEREAALEVVDDRADVGHDREQAERPVVGAEVDVAAVADDSDDDVDQLAVAAACGRGRVEHAVAAEEERVVVEEVGERDRHELPATATGRTGTGGRDDAVELEFIVVRRVDRTVAVVVVLEVDLQGVVLTGVGVDPEVEVLGARQVGSGWCGRNRRRSQACRRIPSRSRARTRRRQRGGRSAVVGGDAAAADCAVEREPAVAERVAVLHVVEDDLVERGRRAGGERDLVEIDLDGGTDGALNAGE